MTPDQCFVEMAVVLGLPTDTGYIAILDMMKKLKEENECLEATVEMYVQHIKDLNRDMEESEKKLKKENEEKIEELEEKIEGLEEKIDEQYEFSYFKKMKDLQQENEKLKDEACDYESMRKHRNTLLEDSEERFMKIHNLEEENEKLKEENQNFKEILDEVREYLGRFDGDEVEVFDKIVKGE